MTADMIEIMASHLLMQSVWCMTVFTVFIYLLINIIIIIALLLFVIKKNNSFKDSVSLHYFI